MQYLHFLQSKIKQRIIKGNRKRLNFHASCFVELLLSFFSFFAFQDSPPVYDVTKMTTPTAFFFAGHDSVSNATEVEAVIPEITNLVVLEYIPKWNHVDFIIGKDAAGVLYENLVKIMNGDTAGEQ